MEHVKGVDALRIAVISDIHGNLPALEAVLKDVAAQSVEATVCLGDLAFKGPMPGECVTRIRELGIPCVHGNTDLMLLQVTDLTPVGTLPDWGRFPTELRPFLEWHVNRMSRTDLEFLAGLPFSYQMEGVRFVHASPQDCVTGIKPRDDREAITERVLDLDADCLVMGHIHQAFAFRMAGKMLVNAGAIGFSQDRNWRASYAVLDTERGSVSLMRVPYDLEALVTEARARGFCFEPEWYGQILRDGYWPPVPWAEQLKSHTFTP